MTVKIEKLEEAKTISRQARATLPYRVTNNTTNNNNWGVYRVVVRRFLLIAAVFGIVIGFVFGLTSPNGFDTIFYAIVSALCFTYIIMALIKEFVEADLGRY